jgi:hypothetical protein
MGFSVALYLQCTLKLFAKNCYLAPGAAASLADAPCRARTLQNARQRVTPKNEI